MVDAGQILYDDTFLKISCLPSASDSVVLCFTGIGHSLGGLDVQQTEFTGTSLRLGMPVFITDKTRSWGNKIDLAQVAQIIAPVTAGKSVVALGNSMGAFLAIAASSVLNLRHVFAFAPQFSVDPAVVPDEARWKKYRDHIMDFRIPSLERRFAPACQYDIFVGDDPLEKMHWEKFPHAPNIRCFIVPNTQHDVALEMKARGHLQTILADCKDPDLSAANLAERYGYILRDHAASGHPF